MKIERTVYLAHSSAEVNRVSDQMKVLGWTRVIYLTTTPTPSYPTPVTVLIFEREARDEKQTTA